MQQNKIDKLIIGLGNVGKEYQNTRHNIGFMVATNFANKFNTSWHTVNKIAKYTVINDISGNNILLALPLTYMNNSGKAIKYFLQKLEIETSNMLVIVDEYNFPLGKVHLKKVNSDGGHNGIASIINETESNNFYILRCGIDKNFGQGEMPDYVLSSFESNEIESRNKMIVEATEAIECFIKNKPDKAMSFINSRKTTSEN